MKYPVMTLWTWDGTRQRYKVLSDKNRPFKADIIKYTDRLGYGPYIEIVTNENLDFNVGGLVHNVPTHENNEAWDLTGFWWCMQMFKLSENDDKRNHYALVDLTFGKSKDFKFRETPRGKGVTSSPFMRALSNANPDKTGLFMDGQPPNPNTRYLSLIDDSKTNIMYDSGSTEGHSRDDLIDLFQRIGERHSPKMDRIPRFGNSGYNRFDWFLEQPAEFRVNQSFDVMLDEYELEEIADINDNQPYTAYRQWHYKTWSFTDSSGKKQIMKDETKANLYTQYLDENNRIQSAWIKDRDVQEVFGFPVFYTQGLNAEHEVRGELPPPKLGAIKYIEVDPVDTPDFYDFTQALNQGYLLNKEKSYKVYRALDVNQRVQVNYRVYTISEVDYINEISVIGKARGVI